MRRVLLAAHARDVNIFIWTSRKSVGQMIALWSMVKVHELMAAGPVSKLILARYWGLETDDPRRASWGLGTM